MSRNSQNIDVFVGMRLRQQRNSLEISRETLAERLNVSDADMEQYELGLRPIGSSRLIDLARILNVPISFFFHNLPMEIEDSSACSGQMELVTRPGSISGATHSKDDHEVQELVEAFYGIDEASLRKQLLAIMRSLHNVQPEVQMGSNVTALSQWRIRETKRRAARISESQSYK